ncbi:MAG: TetR/AcrR family transcriptional regulator [Endomicrobiaceae bacterium]|nr:TetR/AcrR family transcriptional regulator [Endomicrobiaceae bacterium]
MKKIDILREEQTRTDIIATAQKLFQKYGIDKTTMDDIAREVGKGKSTLYYYYTSKEEVFYAVVNKEKDEVMKSIKKTISNLESPSEQLKTFFLSHFNELKHKINLYSVILQGNVKKHIDLFGRIQKENISSEIEMIKEILLKGIKNGEFKNIKEKDCEDIAIICVTVIQGLDSSIIFFKDEAQKELRIETATDIFIKGLQYRRQK